MLGTERPRPLPPGTAIRQWSNPPRAATGRHGHFGLDSV